MACIRQPERTTNLSLIYIGNDVTLLLTYIVPKNIVEVESIVRSATNSTNLIEDPFIVFYSFIVYLFYFI